MDFSRRHKPETRKKRIEWHETKSLHVDGAASCTVAKLELKINHLGSNSTYQPIFTVHDKTRYPIGLEGVMLENNTVIKNMR